MKAFQPVANPQGSARNVKFVTARTHRRVEWCLGCMLASRGAFIASALRELPGSLIGFNLWMGRRERTSLS